MLMPHHPRVHFALNCSAVPCPRLPRAPAGLDDELQRQKTAVASTPYAWMVASSLSVPL